MAFNTQTKKPHSPEMWFFYASFFEKLYSE